MFSKITKRLITILIITASLGQSHTHEFGWSIWSIPNRLQNFIGSIDDYVAPTTEKYDRSLVDSSTWGFFNKIDKNSPFSYLSRPMDKKSQRENWFAVSPSIAEFYCFASNLAILGVGIQDESWYSILAGTMSGISHAIPTKFAHNLDRIGVAAVVLVCMANYSAILESPETLCAGLAAMTIHGADALMSRKYGDVVGPWLHVAWHFSAAYGLHQLNMTLSGATVPSS